MPTDLNKLKQFLRPATADEVRLARDADSSAPDEPGYFAAEEEIAAGLGRTVGISAGVSGPLAVSSLAAVKEMMRQRVAKGVVEEPDIEPLTPEQHRAIASAEPAGRGLLVESLGVADAVAAMTDTEALALIEEVHASGFVGTLTDAKRAVLREGFERNAAAAREGQGKPSSEYFLDKCGSESKPAPESESVSENLARMQSPAFKRTARALERDIPEDAGFGRFRDVSPD